LPVYAPIIGGNDGAIARKYRPSVRGFSWVICSRVIHA